MTSGDTEPDTDTEMEMLAQRCAYGLRCGQRSAVNTDRHTDVDEDAETGRYTGSTALAWASQGWLP